jgi:hypothetical protein
MKIKSTVFIVVVFLFSSLVYTQDLEEQLNIEKKYTDKKRFIYGAGACLLWPHGQLGVFHYGIQPQFGYFPARNFAVLGILHGSYGATSSPGNFVINAGAGPELRYYLGKASFKFYVCANAIPHYSYHYQGYFGIMAGGGPGFAFFTGSKFSISLTIYVGVYRTTAYNFNQPIGAFSLVFNGLFTKRKKGEINDQPGE